MALTNDDSEDYSQVILEATNKTSAAILNSAIQIKQFWFMQKEILFERCHIKIGANAVFHLPNISNQILCPTTCISIKKKTYSKALKGENADLNLIHLKKFLNDFCYQKVIKLRI